MAQVKCQTFDFELETFFEPEVCEPPAKNKSSCCEITQVRNMKYRGYPSDIDGNPLDQEEHHIRFVIQRLSRIHLIIEDIPFMDCAVALNIQRILACQEGCDTDYNAINEPWRGSGMMVPPGEYMISIPTGIAYGADPCGFSPEMTPAGHVTVVVEPVEQDHVWAALFNQAKC